MKKTKHSYTDLKYHLVIVPKYRKEILKGNLAELVRKVILAGWMGHHYIQIIEYAIQSDHVHIFFQARPDTRLVREISKLKTEITKWAFIKDKDLEKKLGSRNLWSRGYFLSSTGINAAVVANYINKQK